MQKIPKAGARAVQCVQPAVIAVPVNIVPMAAHVAFAQRRKAIVNYLNLHHHNHRPHQNNLYPGNARPSPKKDRGAAGQPVRMVTAGNMGGEP